MRPAERRSRSTATARVLTIVCVIAALAAAAVRAQRSAPFAALPLVAEAPADNPTTPEKVALGRLLFWDPILSGDRDVACATCHYPSEGYAELRDLSIGATGIGLGATRRHAAGSTVPFVKRNSQTVLNAAFNGMDPAGDYQPAAAAMFWDLRVRGLEAQAIEPIRSLEEMRGTRYAEQDIFAEVESRLRQNATYRQLFAETFAPDPTPVTIANVGRAIATFERTLITPHSPFDRYMRGETSALGPAEVRGLRQFEAAGCAGCHVGPMFSDYRPHVLGIPSHPALREPDAGAGGDAFRTPTLRNLARTAPYGHNGVFASLDAVLTFYEQNRASLSGAAAPPNPHIPRPRIDPLVAAIDVPASRGDLLAFLDALNDDGFDQSTPSSVPSGLPPGGHIHP